MDTNEIERRIQTLEGGKFQKMCAALLKKEFPSYDIQLNGGSIGNDKTTTGHPDFLLIPRNNTQKFILVECTTETNRIDDKAKKDVLACLEEEKTHIDLQMIEEIIFCFSGKMIGNKALCEIKEKTTEHDIVFESKCITELAIEISSYPSIARDYLSLSLSLTKCVFTIDEYIQEIAEKKALLIDLNKKLECRQLALDEIRYKLNETDFLTLSGEPGVGKTALALKYAKRMEDKGTKCSVIRGNGDLSLDEIAEETIDCGLIIIDDFSTSQGNFGQIAKYFKGKKVLITTRDYNRSYVEQTLNDCGISFETYDVAAFSEDELKQVLQTNLPNLDALILQRIVEVAKGNALLAFMLADFVGNDGKKLLSLHNVTDVLKEFNSRQILKLEGKKDEKIFKTIGMIAFLNRITLDSLKDDDPIFMLSGIKRDEFMNEVRFLEENGFVTIHQNAIVEIKDKILADYLIYYVFLEKRLILLSDMINAFFKSFPDNLVETFNMLLELFYTKENEIFLSDEIKKSWLYFVKQGDSRFLKLFCAKFALLNEWNSMNYLSEHALDKMTDVRNGGVDWRISILSALLGKDEETRMCCQIIEKMVNNRSINFEEITSMLISDCGIQPYSYSKKYAVQQRIISYFLDESKECSLGFLKKYCLDLLRFINQHWTIRGNKITYMTIEVCDGEENFRKLRDRCFEVLFKCDDFYDSLKTYFSNNCPQEDSLTIFEDDLITIQKALNENKKRNLVLELSVYLIAKKTLDYYSIPWAYMENHLKDVLNLILPIFDACRNIDFMNCDNYQKETKLKEYVQNVSLEDNLKRLQFFDEMLECSTDFVSEINYFCATLISSLNKQEILDCISTMLSFKNLENKTYGGYEKALIKKLLQEMGVEDTYSFLLNVQNSDFKEKNILYFWEIAFEKDKDTSLIIFDEYLRNIEVALPSNFDVSYLLRGRVPPQKIYSLLKVYFCISNETNNADYQLIFNPLSSEGKKFFDYLLQNDIRLLEKIYLLCLEQDKNCFDWNGLNLSQIVERDNKFATEILKKLYESGGCLEGLERMKAVWESNSYLFAGNDMFEYLKLNLQGNIIFKGTYIFGYNTICQKVELTSNQRNWLISYLNNHQDEKSIKCLNALCRQFGNETRMMYEKQLIKQKVSAALVVGSLEVPSFFSYNKSVNEIIDPLIDLCESLLKWIPQDLDFLEYGSKIDNQKTKLKGMIE